MPSGRLGVGPAILLFALALLAWSAAPACPQEPATAMQPTAEAAQAAAEPTDGFGPLLPEEGLLDQETWVRLGRSFLAALIDHAPRLLAALLVLTLFLVIAKVSSTVVTRTLARTRADPALKGIAGKLTWVSIALLGTIMAAAQAGIEVGSLLAGVGVAGLAIGLAAQDSLSNVVAGLTILWDRPFRTGDRVTIAQQYGEVTEVGLRSTRIRTVNHLDVIIPNRSVIENLIVNHTLNPRLRLDVPLGIAYREDSRQAREVLLAAVRGDDFVVDRPEPEVVVIGLGDSSVDLQLRVWLRDPTRERAAMCHLIEVGKIALDEAGIEIPFPQRTLHFPEQGPPLRHVESSAESSVEGS